MKQRRRGGEGLNRPKKVKPFVRQHTRFFLGTEVFNFKKKEAEKVIKRKESEGGRAGVAR